MPKRYNAKDVSAFSVKLFYLDGFVYVEKLVGAFRLAGQQVCFVNNSLCATNSFIINFITISMEQVTVREFRSCAVLQRLTANESQ